MIENVTWRVYDGESIIERVYCGVYSAECVMENVKWIRLG